MQVSPQDLRTILKLNSFRVLVKSFVVAVLLLLLLEVFSTYLLLKLIDL